MSDADQPGSEPHAHSTSRGDRTPSANRYTVTYEFNGYLRGEYAEAIAQIRETIAELRREELEVAFLGATLEINGAGQLTTVTARYMAPSKGTVGRLNCRAKLPACGSPQHKQE